jgi:hypothetical protein
LLPTTGFKACEGYEYDVDISVTDYQESDERQPCIVMVFLGQRLRIIERVHLIYHAVPYTVICLKMGRLYLFVPPACLPVGVVVLDCGLLFGHKIIYLQIMHILSTPILFKLLLCLFLAYQLYSIPDNNKQQPTIIFKGNIFFHSRSVRDSCAFFLKKRVLVKKNKGSYDLKPQIEFLRRPSSIVCLIIVCSKVTY